MLILVQFILRMSFGMAGAMALVSPRQVTSGYYRNNLYVLLGLNVLAAMVSRGAAAPGWTTWLIVGAAIASYVGAVAWLYEQPKLGLALLVLIAGLDLAATYRSAQNLTTANETTAKEDARSGDGPGDNAILPSTTVRALTWLDPISGGVLLGVTMAAMLLGHWYLNAPGMPLAPLERLIGLLAAGVVLRAIVCGWGLSLELAAVGPPDRAQWLFIALRWLGGLVGTEILAIMAWRTLKVPNTQSATGILYVAVITTFLGELASGLLSAQSAFPL